MGESSGSSGMRFLSFANDKEDAEKAAKLKEAALRIEQAIERQRSVNELVDYKPPPEEAIDLANDTRPLYERLLEQKNRKQEALEESQKLSNFVLKLDEDEAGYLNELAKTQREEELRKRLEVYDALEEKKRHRERKIIEEERKLKESFLGSKIPPSSSKLKLSSLVKVKPRPRDKMVSNDQESKRPADQSGADNKRLKTSDDTNLSDSEKRCTCVEHKNVMKCIGVLPSLPLVGAFPDSSDSDNSDDNLNPRIVPRVGGRNK